MWWKTERKDKKVMLLDAETGSSAMAAKEYTVAISKPGYAEQTPAVWWNALKEVLYQLKTKRPGNKKLYLQTKTRM